MTVAGFRSRLRTAIHLAPHVVLRAAALCALYIAAGLLGRLAEEAGDGGRILLPQSGVALAGLVVLGTRYFPAVVAASLFLTLQANVAWPLAWGFAAGNTAGAVAGAWLLRRVGRFDPRMARVRDVYALLVLAVGVSSLVSATLVVPWAAAFGDPGVRGGGWGAWFGRWFGQGVSNLIVAPFLLAWSRRPADRWTPARVGESALLMLAVLWACLTVFTGQSAIAQLNSPASFLPFPIVLWATLRSGPRGAATAVFLVAAIAVFGTTRGYGPFHGSGGGGLLLLQVYLASMALSALFLAAALAERYDSEDELRASRGRLRALSASLQQAREDERKRLSREIHDELGQQLTGMKMGLHALAKKLPPGADIPAAKCRELMDMADEAVRSVRQIATDLRPGILDDLGLVPSLQWLVADFAERSGLAATFVGPGAELTVDANRSIALFRIVQEALTNVARHAQASKVEVSLTTMEDCLVLEVADDGVGIDNRAAGPRPTDSLGLVGMAERATLLGGTLRVTHRAAPARGTVVRARIPFPTIGGAA